MNQPFTPINRPRRPKQHAQFEQFDATELYCLKCRQAVPVRKFLLLILPDGEKYEYRCVPCGSKVGYKMDRSGEYFNILKT